MNKLLYKQRTGFLISYLLLILPIIGYIQNILISNKLVFSLQLVSIVGIVLITLIMISWKTIGGKLLSPYIITIVSLYFVLCGQSFLWSFGLSAGYRDLLQSAYWNISEIQACKALWYAYGCFAFAHIAAVLSTNQKIKTRQNSLMSQKVRNNDETSDNGAEIKFAAIAASGIILSILGAVPFGIESLRNYAVMQAEGYGAQYDGTSLSGIFGLAADLFPCGVLCLLFSWGRGQSNRCHHNVIKSSTAYVLALTVVFSNLVTGKRTVAILFALAIVVIRCTHRPIKGRTILLLTVVSIIGMVALRGVDMWRSGNSGSALEVIEYFLSGEGNPAIDFVGDVGWNMLSTVKVQEILPSSKGFSFGLSYIASFAGFVPNVGQWAVNPASEYSDLGNWLQGALGISYGPGFSPVAEAWYNFGYAGILVFILWGRILAWLSEKSDEIDDPISQLIVILFIGLVLKSAVRSCFFPTLRSGIALLCCTLILVQICLATIRQRNRRMDEHRNRYMV